MPVVSLTLAIFLSAEFGFFGVMVRTCRQTPLRCGQLFNAGDLDFFFFEILPNLISWEIVGIVLFFYALLFRLLVFFCLYSLSLCRFDHFDCAMIAKSGACRNQVADDDVFFEAK